MDFVRVKLENLFELTAENAEFHFTRSDGDPLAEFDVAVSIPALGGIGGSVDNLRILEGGVPDFDAIEGFGFRPGTAGQTLFDDAFQLLPIQVDEFKVRFKEGLFTAPPPRWTSPSSPPSWRPRTAST